jgi:hypothetical protein
LWSSRQYGSTSRSILEGWLLINFSLSETLPAPPIRTEQAGGLALSQPIPPILPYLALGPSPSSPALISPQERTLAMSAKHTLPDFAWRGRRAVATPSPNVPVQGGCARIVVVLRGVVGAWSSGRRCECDHGDVFPDLRLARQQAGVQKSASTSRRTPTTSLHTIGTPSYMPIRRHVSERPPSSLPHT